MSDSDRALNMNLIFRFFDAANMHRWNDHLRPMDLTELDKQAHKVAIAWYIGKKEEDSGAHVDWTRIIEYCMFSFIQRTALTDLKPEIFHKIKKERSEEIAEYVLSEFDNTAPDMETGFRRRFEDYIRSDRKRLEESIIRGAHYLATKWEFDLISDMNRSFIGIEKTREAIRSEVEMHKELVGVRDILLGGSAMDFTNMIGQLRFQQRWTRTPRIPQTTVLGHSLMVSNMTYLHDLDRGTGPRQKYNDYFTALFHDLPEVLTKDVISPVKTNVSGLAELLNEYETDSVRSEIMPLLPEEWRDEFKFMIFDPFRFKDDPVHGVTDGPTIKLFDVMGAYMEAYVSRRYGISSSSLRIGEDDLRSRLIREGGSVGAADLINRLESMDI
ncbi:MAG: HD domain-containing protein [Candidatus Methanomethylophilaceae archaeon]|jgi:putative hydrolase of HD superfamily|nr:haloacid dehalogenase [Methanomassiliicoccales archaeon RumEn M2]MDD3128464.1 HD domain-containing protein [Candidatus Methanomethylophilaceae archaeon]MDD4118935.1 HD domain-containing protein [Candidatus Methanomethylophilaceae archaeon]MDI9378995.1 HD domain-containing protein [Candidatus Thermoplasmatota archaeon]